MAILKKLMAIFCLSNIFILGNEASEPVDDFVTVEKRGVVHKFAKMGVQWADDFLVTLFQNNWEEDTFDVFEIVADKNGIAIDIGAWVGTTSIWLSKNFSHVIALEADKESTVFLKKNLIASDCTNVTLCDKALADTNGTVIFGPRTAISDSLNFSTSYIKKEQSSKNDFEVPAITIDQLVKHYINENPSLKDRKVTFIKCDIEGGEENILKDVLHYADINNCKVWMSFHCDWWNNKKITDFQSEFANFNAICAAGDICDYIQKYPFGSVLLIPKRL